jgi:heme exporter protein C
MWSWFHKLGSPKWFYAMAGRWLPWLTAATVLTWLVGLSWGLLIAPMDYRQGNSFRIIYVHVPVAVVSLAGYYLMATAAAVHLIWRIKLADMVVKSGALIGAVLTFQALLTGAIWGKPTWGTWWVWDARITSMLVLFLVYMGIVLLYEALSDRPEQASRVCAILALVGTVNIPIIYKSVDWWYSLHQPATIRLTGAPSMDPSMFYPLLCCIVACYLLYASLMTLYVRGEILRREMRAQWLQDLVRSRQ